MYDIVPTFVKALVFMPLEDLYEMKHDFEVRGSGSQAVQKAILALSVEILRRKWGCR